MEILSIWRRERCCLSVIVLARAAVVSSFRGRRSVGRPSLPKGTRRDTHVFGTGWIWRIWRGSNPIRERFRHCFVTEMRENDARLSRAHPVPYITFAPLLRRRSAFLPSVRPSVRPSKRNTCTWRQLQCALYFFPPSPSLATTFLHLPPPPPGV